MFKEVLGLWAIMLSGVILALVTGLLVGYVWTSGAIEQDCYRAGMTRIDDKVYECSLRSIHES